MHEDTEVLVDRLLDLHRRNTHFPHYCVHCRAPYPCRTVQLCMGEADTSEPSANPTDK